MISVSLVGIQKRTNTLVVVERWRKETYRLKVNLYGERIHTYLYFYNFIMIGDYDK